MEREGAAKRRHGDGSMDRLSILPEPILHHILCFLDQRTAIQTCVLSKAWRYLWCTRPKFDFHDYIDGAFLSILDRTLRGYHDRKLRLDEFTLHMFPNDFEGAEDDATLLLDKWIPIVIQSMGVKSFDLVVFFLCSRTKSGQFEVPSLVFESDSIRNLSLEFVGVPPGARMHHSNRLKKLCLTGVCISEEILDDVFSNSCPFIEDVSLVSCTGFKRIKLLNNNTKTTSLKQFRFYDGINVSIEIGGHAHTQTPLRTIDISRCLLSVNHDGQPLELAHLIRLSLKSVKLSSDVFSCSLPCLEELTLDDCVGIREFNLVSGSMKRLVIDNPNTAFTATIDAPSIASFSYKGILPQSFSFATTSDDWKSEIILTPDSDEPASHSFNELCGLLKALSQSEISLELDRNQICELFLNLIQSQYVGGSKAYKLHLVVDHLTIKRPKENSRRCGAYFITMVFRMFRPSFIRMETDASTTLSTGLEGVIELLFSRRKLRHGYFWRSVLEEVSLQVLYQDQSEWLPVEYTSFTQLRKVPGDFSLHFKWRV